MCGICGFVKTVDAADRKLVAYANRARGTEGWGAMWWDGQEWEMKKRGEDLHHGIIDRLIKWDAPALLVHVRRASPDVKVAGGQHTNNTHPFTNGHITLAHNGYVRNWEKLCEADRTFVVDSDALSYAVNKHGIDVLKNVQGSAACWWIDDRQQDRINLWVWNQDFVFAKTDGGFCFSSTAVDLRLAAEMKGVSILKPKDGMLMQVGLNGEVIDQKKWKGSFTPVVTTCYTANDSKAQRLEQERYNPQPGSFSKVFQKDTDLSTFNTSKLFTYGTAFNRPSCPECGYVSDSHARTQHFCPACRTGVLAFNVTVPRWRVCTGCYTIVDADVILNNEDACPVCGEKTLSNMRDGIAVDVAAYFICMLSAKQKEWTFDNDKREIMKVVKYLVDHEHMLPTLLQMPQDKANVLIAEACVADDEARKAGECAACKGSGRSSKGGECAACKGHGTKKIPEEGALPF